MVLPELLLTYALSSLISGQSMGRFPVPAGPSEGKMPPNAQGGGPARKSHHILLPDQPEKNVTTIAASVIFPQNFKQPNPPTCRSRFQNLTDNICSDVYEEVCLEDEDYNGDVEEKFRSLLLSSPEFIKDVLDNNILADPEENQNSISTRFGSFNSETTACLARETIIYPKRAQTANSDWVFVLNQPGLQQGVRVETCVVEGDECRFGGVGLPHTTCRQKYIYKKLLAMNTYGTQIVPESILLPSCCVCYISNGFILPRSFPTSGDGNRNKFCR